MPEIAMNKNNQLLPRKNKIWRAGKPCIVFGKRQARSNEQIADVPFRCRIFAADTGHQSPSFLGRHDVRHRVLLHTFISFLQSFSATTTRTLRYLIPPRALATGSGKSISSWILGVSLSTFITSVKRRRPRPLLPASSTKAGGACQSTMTMGATRAAPWSAPPCSAF